MINLLLVTHFYPARRGGIEIAAGKIAESLVKNFQINIKWMASNSDEAPVINDRITTQPLQTLNIVEKIFPFPYPVITRKELGKVREAVEQADIVHIHDFFYMSNLEAACHAKKVNKPLLVTQHVGWIPYNSHLLRTVLKRVNKKLGREILTSADEVVFISEGVREYYSKLCKLGSHVTFIPNGVEPSVFKPVPVPIRLVMKERIGIARNTPVFLFVGRFTEKKGLLMLRDLAKRLKNVLWIFAGSGSINPESWNLPNVKVFRNNDWYKMAKLYQLADLLVLPSKGEGFPLVVQESMACGTPAIVSHETAAAYTPLETLIFSEDVGSKDAVDRWYFNLSEMAENLDLINNMRRDIAEFAIMHWSWERSAYQYFNIISRLISTYKTLNKNSALS